MRPRREANEKERIAPAGSRGTRPIDSRERIPVRAHSLTPSTSRAPKDLGVDDEGSIAVGCLLVLLDALAVVEIGDGFACASYSGEENADEMRIGPDGKPVFLSNHAGGILGGISTGQPIVARFAVKPTSSILTPRLTIDGHGHETNIATKGRHDPCVGIRAVPVGEAMMALVLADHFLRHRAQTGR